MQWNWKTRVLVSVILALHFALLAVTFASNNIARRSELSDRILVDAQPYLIGLGWYTELLPVSLATGELQDNAMRIEYKKSKQDLRWTTWFDSRKSDGRWRRLASLAGALADHEDTDGIGLIAHTLVTRAAKEGIPIDRIRFAMPSAQRSGDGNPSQEAIAIYEASVIPLAEDDVTLIPQIEPTRSVPPFRGQTNTLTSEEARN